MKQTVISFAITLSALFCFVNCGSNTKNNQEQEAQKETVQEGKNVIIDENGEASNGGKFIPISDNSFYLDYVGYKIVGDENAYIVVAGYKPDLEGAAEIVSSITYKGKEYKVEAISENAFRECKRLTSIVVNYGVEKMYEGAFRDCEKLQSVTLPDNMKQISKEAFKGCESLTTIHMPEALELIDVLAFEGCKSLTEIKFPENLQTIRFGAFAKCESLKSVVIPNATEEIEHDAFDAYPALESIVVEDGNPNYDSRKNCNALIETKTNKLMVGCKNTTIPEGVLIIGNHAFAGCTSLTNIAIPSTVIYIGEYAFRDCGLVAVDIPNSVSHISSHAFQSCKQLESVKLGFGLKEVGSEAFGLCESLVTMKSLCEEMPTGLAYAFMMPNPNAILYVPKGSKDSYRISAFSKIVEEE